MSILMEKEIPIDKIVTINYEQFKALEDPIRGKIIQMLYKKKLNVEQIHRRLKKIGFKKAVTTIRHHVEILKNSGLIEIVKIEELQGATTKYYIKNIIKTWKRNQFNFKKFFKNQENKPN